MWQNLVVSMYPPGRYHEHRMNLPLPPPAKATVSPSSTSHAVANTNVSARVFSMSDKSSTSSRDRLRIVVMCRGVRDTSVIAPSTFLPFMVLHVMSASPSGPCVLPDLPVITSHKVRHPGGGWAPSLNLTSSCRPPLVSNRSCFDTPFPRNILAHKTGLHKVIC